MSSSLQWVRVVHVVLTPTDASLERCRRDLLVEVMFSKPQFLLFSPLVCEKSGSLYVVHTNIIPGTWYVHPTSTAVLAMLY